MHKNRSVGKLRFKLLAVLGIAVGGLLLFGLFQPPAGHAAAGINQQLNFQGRLLDNTGAVVPDGSYNMEFKIYQDGAGCVSGGTSPCGGTLKWTEDWIQTNRVTVKNGYFSVNLGALTAFASNIDWNQDNLWLSTNIGGTSNTPTPTWDGEMTPFKRLAAAPYSLNSNALGGLTAANFVQLAQGVQADTSTVNPSIFINKNNASGAPNILELQKSGVDVFNIDNTGNIAATGKYNSDTINSSAITFGSASTANIDAAAGQTLQLGASSAAIKLAADTTITGAVNLSSLANCSSLATSASGNLGCGSSGPTITSAFTDTTPANYANNTTTELFNDATKPSITPPGSDSTILVSVDSRGHGTSTTDSSSQVRIVRNIGSAASCSSSAQVGDVINVSFTTNNNATDKAEGSGVFLDSPATTSQVFYTICSNATTGGQAEDRLTVTLVALGGTAGAGGGTSTESLQDAYTIGNVINANDGADLAFNLTDAATDPNFLVDLQCSTACGGNGRFAVQDSSSDVFSVNPNGGDIILAPAGSGNVVVNSDTDSNFQINYTTATDDNQSAAKVGITDNANASSGSLYGISVVNNDNGANTGVPDALAYLSNANAGDTVSDGLLIEQTGTGTLANAAEIRQTAGAITTGLAFTGTFTSVLKVGSTTVLDGSGVVQSASISGTYSNALALSNSSNSYSGVTLGATADGFTAAGGSSTSRTLTVTGADITLGSTITPTASGVLTVQSNGANDLNLDAGGAASINIGNGSATDVDICNSGACDTVNIATNTDTDTINIGDSHDTTNIAGFVQLSNLANCTALMTDASGNLSCGSGGGGSNTASFTDTTPANYANNTTTELFNDATKPSITPTTTTSAVLVSVDSRGHGTNAGDSSSQIRIVRNIGSAASCSTSAQVGDVINVSFTTNNATTDKAEGTGVFLDSPATTSQVFYTICSNALSGGQTQDRLTISLVALGGSGGGGGGSSPSTESLQDAYDIGNAVNASDGNDLAFNLTDATTDPNFLVNLECTTSCAGNGRFAVQSGGADVLSVAPNSGDITLAPAGSGNVVINGDDDSSLQVNSTVSSDTSQSAQSVNLTDNANASTGSLYGLSVINADNGANTGVPDALAYLKNANAAETLPDGLLVEQTGAGTLTNGLEVKQTAGAITNGLAFTGTFTSVLKVGSTTVLDGSGVVQSASISGTYSNILTLNNSSNVYSGTTYNGLSLTSAADGFTAAGGATSRTLTVTGADITLGSTITPTSSGVLTVQSNGANALNLDTGGAALLNIGNTNATGVSICNSAACDTVNIGTNADADAINIGDSNDTTTVSGSVKFSSLTSCTSLATNASGVLGCGNGDPDTAAFSDTNPAAFANNTTTELFNNTPRPSITPTSTSQTVLVTVTIRAHGTSTSDSNASVRVVHNTGSAPSCSTSSQVGGAIATNYTTSNGTADITGGSGIFLDSPATTSTEFYTVCSSALTGTQGDDEIDVTLIALGADYAENYYTTDDSIGPGNVVSIDSSLPAGAQKSRGAYDKNVLGIVSTAPYKVADDKIGAAAGRAVPVALAGRVPVNVTTENGPIQPGDLLTTSAIVPGAAMKATRSGQVIGQAMTAYSGSGVGQVFAFVKTEYSTGPSIDDLMQSLNITDPDGSSDSSSLSTSLLAGLVNLANQSPAPTTLSDITTDRLAAGVEVITPKLSANQIYANSIEAANGSDISLKLASDGQFIISGSSGNSLVSFDSAGNANFSGTITADKIVANQIQGMEVITDEIHSLSGQLAQEKSAKTTAVSGVSANLAAGVALNTGNSSGLLSLKNVQAVNLTVLAQLYAKGGFTVDGASIFNGTAQFKGQVSFNNDAGGTALIKQGATKVQIKFSKAYQTAPIITVNYLFNSSDSGVDQSNLQDLLDNGYNFVVTQTTTKGFTILLNKPAGHDTNFSWLATQIDNPQVSKSEDPSTSSN